MQRKDIAAMKQHRPLVLAALARWGLDGVDFTLLIFFISQLGKMFNVTLPKMAFVLPATRLAKVVGTIAWGAAADKWGRKLPFIVAVL